jgi:uncharacterized repeat protein (TIGR01451 family)
MPKRFDVSLSMSGLLSIRGGKSLKPLSRPARLTLAALGGFVLVGLWLTIVARVQDNAQASSPLEPCSTGPAIVAGAHSSTGTLPNRVIIAASDPLCTNADLTVAKTVNNAILDVGEAITYTVMVTNAGPDDASGVQLTDVLPESAIFRSATPQDVCTKENNTVTCDLGHLPNGDSAIVTIVVTPTQAGTITNMASVTSDASDPDQSNNTAEKTNRVTGADLVVTKTVNITEPKAGDSITYTITVANNGPDNATEVRVTDTLPAGVTFSGYTATRGTYITDTDLWSVGNLANAARATMTIAASVISCTGYPTMPNTASISAAWPNDPDPENNESRAVITPTSGVYCLYLPVIFKNFCIPFTDTFASSSSGWPEVDNERLKTKYVDDQYLMLARNEKLQYAINRRFANYFANYEIEVDAHWFTNTTTGEGYGIVFGLANNDSHTYLYQINTDRREYRLLRYSNGRWWHYSDASWKLSTNIDKGWIYTNTINSNPTPNRLKVIRSSSQIILYVNNTHLETAIDNVITSGRVGLSVLSYYNDPQYGSRDADARFDNYSFNFCIGTTPPSVNAEHNPPASILSIGALPRPN